MVSEELPSDPGGVWQLVIRADDLVKYASNRDAGAAYAQAREVLDRAETAASSLADRNAASGLLEQIARRRDDLARRMEAGA